MYFPKIFLIILGLFSIFGHLLLDGAAAQPFKKQKERNLFNYDDVLDLYQDQHDRRLKPGHNKKKEECESGKYHLQQMPSKPVLSEDDAELAFRTDMSIYTDDDVAWEHEHGRSGIPKPQKLRALPAAKKQQLQTQSHSELEADSELESHSKSQSQVESDSLSDSLDSETPSKSKSQSHPLPVSLYSSYARKESNPFIQKNIMNPEDMSINKWNWMEKILRQQAIGI